jgi:hypothetical protein
MAALLSKSATTLFAAFEVATGLSPGSSALLQNPDPLSGQSHEGMDLATALVGVVDVRAQQLTVTPVPVTTMEATVFHGAVATFTFPGPTFLSTDFSATIDWGDDSGGPVPADVILQTTSPTTYQVIGTHTYLHAGAYPITVTVTDTRDNISANSVENVSQRPLDQSETTIAINPKNPSQIFVASNDETGAGLADAGTGGGLFAAISDCHDALPNRSQRRMRNSMSGAELVQE